MKVTCACNVTSNNNNILGKPASFDLSITFPLNPSVIFEASVTTGVARTTEQRKPHRSNDAKCDEPSWVSGIGGAWNLMELEERRL